MNVLSLQFFISTFVFCGSMKFIDKKTIHIDRELSDLDTFAVNFTKILQKHTAYVIVSGYVAILLGRARASEEIDIIIPRIDFSTFGNKPNGSFVFSCQSFKDRILLPYRLYLFIFLIILFKLF